VREGFAEGNRTIDAVGPETFTYRGLVETIAKIIGVRRLIMSVSPEVGYQAAQMIGKRVGDVFLTRDEIAGLMQGLLATDSPPTGSTKLTDWAQVHAATLGVQYASELARRRNREESYAQL
jgi:NADH dehydrogenase